MSDDEKDTGRSYFRQQRRLGRGRRLEPALTREEILAAREDDDTTVASPGAHKTRTQRLIDGAAR